MKKSAMSLKSVISALVLVAISGAAYGQSGIIMLTEEFNYYAPYVDKVHVVMPDGTSTTTEITSFSEDILQHDKELNTIINGIISQGYELIPEIMWGSSVVEGPNMNTYGLRLLFGVPWTSVVEDLTPTSSENELVSVYPNPANDEITVSVRSEDTAEWVFYIVDQKGLVMQISAHNVIDVASLAAGSYIVYGVSNSAYTLGRKFIRK